MVGSKSKPRSFFSWADEVEREEKEALAQLNQQHKPNPFGSGRPREVVLEEKGIDWRKLEQKLHQSSIPRKEKRLKENSPSVTAPMNRKEPNFQRNMGADQNTERIKYWGSVRDKIGASPVSLMHNNQNAGDFLPQLRYPPKNNTVCPLEVMQKPYNYNASEQNFQYEWHHKLQIKRKREDVIWEHRRRDFAVEELMGQSMEVAHNVRIKRTPPDYGEREREAMDPNHRRKSFSCEERLRGPQLVNERRGAILNHEIGLRSFYGESNWERMEDEYGRQDQVRKRMITVSPIEMPPDGRWRRGQFCLDMDKASFGGYFDNGWVRSTDEERGWEKTEYENKQKRFSMGKFVSPSTSAEVCRNGEMDREGFGRNYRKREMESGANKRHCNQKRRR